MSSEQIPRVPLGNVVTFINGDRSANYPKQDDYVDSGFAFVSAADLADGSVQFKSAKKISAAAFARLRSGKFQHRDVIFCLRGSIGKLAFVRQGETGAIASSLVIVRAGEGVDPSYLYFWLSSSDAQQAALSLNNGSAQPNLSVGQMQRIEIPLPPLEMQQAIVSVLSALDDRITHLRETNATLEAIAQALFKSWFVDFDPVRAKMEGRTPEGMDEATAALFPDSFEETVLGAVPRGWRFSTVGESFLLTMGQSPPGDTYNNAGDGLAFYQGRTDFGFRFPTQRVFCSAPTRFAEAGDTLVSVRAPVGDVNMALERCCIGRGVASVRHAKGYCGFTFYAMRSLGERFKNFDSEGTIFGSINKKDFQSLPIISAGVNLLQAYDDVTSPIDNKIVENEVYIRTLISLRDTLLPGLITGQLRIQELLDFAEAA
jgi:type I restriction enzyme, S subunit